MILKSSQNRIELVTRPDTYLHFRSLLLDHLASPGNGDGATLLMPGLTRRDLKVVLDYVYHGRMTLRAEQVG